MDKLISDLGAAASVATTDVFELEKLAGPPSQKATIAQLQTALGMPAIFKTGVAVSHTGDTNETTLYSQVLPPLLASSVVEIRIGLSTGGAAGPKFAAIKLGATNIWDGVNIPTQNQVLTLDRTIWNRGATNSQVIFHVSTPSATSFASYALLNSVSVVTAAIETNVGATLSITGTLGDAGDSITLEAVRIVVWT